MRDAGCGAVQVSSGGAGPTLAGIRAKVVRGSLFLAYRGIAATPPHHPHPHHTCCPPPCSVPSAPQTRCPAVCSGTPSPPSVSAAPPHHHHRARIENPPEKAIEDAFLTAAKESPVAPVAPPEVPPARASPERRRRRRDARQCACAPRTRHAEGRALEDGDADGAGDAAQGQVLGF
jgi:hypothetical protein